MTDLLRWLGYQGRMAAKIYLRAVLLVFTGLMVFTIVTGLR